MLDKDQSINHVAVNGEKSLRSLLSQLIICRVEIAHGAFVVVGDLTPCILQFSTGKRTMTPAVRLF